MQIRLIPLLYLLLLPLLLIFAVVQLWFNNQQYNQWVDSLVSSVRATNQYQIERLSRDPIFAFYLEDLGRAGSDRYLPLHRGEIRTLLQNSIRTVESEGDPHLPIALGLFPLQDAKQEHGADLVVVSAGEWGELGQMALTPQWQTQADSVEYTTTPQQGQVIMVPLGVDRNLDGQLSGNEISGYLQAIFSNQYELFTQQVQTHLRWLLAGQGGMLLLMTLVIYLAGHIIGRPFGALMRQLQADPKQELTPITGTSSIQELNRLMDTLNHYQQQIESRNREVMMARDEAMAAIKVKERFLATVSHELRTPINGIVGFAQLLEGGEMPPQQRSYLEKLTLSAQTLRHLIDDVLDISRSDSGQQMIETRPMDLLGVVEEAFTIIGPSAYQKGLVLYRVVATDIDHMVLGDAKRVRQILLNLLNNAIKFTHSGSVSLRIEHVGIATGEEAYLISVADSGIGITADQQQRVFDPFVQSDDTIQRRFGGSGLGLAITKQLVASMGGTITLNSLPNVGSTFYVTLPLPIVADVPLPEDEVVLLADTTQLLLYDNHPASRETIYNSLAQLALPVAVFEQQQPYLEAVARAARGEAKVIACIGLENDTDGDTGICSMCQQLKQLDNVVVVILFTNAEQLPMQLAAMGPELVTLPKIAGRAELSRAIRAVTQGKVLDEPQPHRATLSPLNAMDILVVDDHDINLLLAEELLKRQGGRVTAVHDGPAAINITKQRAFDLILMDIQMPFMSGMEVTHYIRQLPQHRNTPIVALTAHVFPEQQQECVEAGMNGVLTKPFDISQLELWVTANMAAHLPVVMPAHPFSAVPAADDAMAVPLDPLPAFDLPRSLRLYPNNRALTHRVWGMLIDELPTLKQQIVSAWGASDWPQLKFKIHSLKGLAGNCSATPLERVLIEIDADLKQDNHSRLSMLIESMVIEIDRVVAWGPLEEALSRDADHGEVQG